MKKYIIKDNFGNKKTIYAENLSDAIKMKDEASLATSINALVTDEKAAIDAYNVAINNLKGKIDANAMQVLINIMKDERKHIENLYAILNNQVTEKNLEDSVEDSKTVGQRVKDAEWSNDWADLEALGIDDRNKASVEAYFKKLASKYGVSYVRTVYGMYPSPIFRGDRKKLEKLILKEYAGNDRSVAEEEYEFIEDSTTKDSKVKDKFYTLSTKWDDRQDFARIAKMYNLKAYSNDTIEGSANNIEEFIHNYTKESFDRDRLYDSKVNDSDSSVGIIFNKLYNSDYDSFDEVKRDFDRLKSTFSDAEKEKIYKEIAFASGMTISSVKQRLEDSIKVDSQPGVRKMRITKDEIESAIEMFVNSVYDDENSGWVNAKFEDWVNAVYEELVTWKMGESGCTFYVLNENRFDGKETIVERIKPLLKKRLTELKEEGYDVKAI